MYEVVDLGSYGEGSYDARAISETGYITGDYRPSGFNSKTRAWVHADHLGGMVDLNQYQGFYSTYAHAIADDGVVGAFTFADNDTSPLLSYGFASGWQHLGQYAPDNKGWLLGRPNGFGEGSNLSSFDRGYVFDRASGQAFDIAAHADGYTPGAGGGSPAADWSINETVQMKNGRLVGNGLYLGGAESAFEAFMWTPEHGLVRMGPSIDADEAEVMAVSSNGFAAFRTVDFPEGGGGPGGGPQPNRGFIGGPVPESPELGSVIGRVDPQTGAISDRVDYGVVFEFTGVNNWGHAVGLGADEDFNTPATIFRDGRQQRVGDAIARMSPGWTVAELNDINSRGEIVGTAYQDGERRAVMLRLAAAPHQVQNDVRAPAGDRWGNDALLGNASYTIGRYGCFLTSTSMLLNTFGHNTDPEKLNDALAQNMTDSPGYMVFGNVPEAGFYGQTDGEEGLPVSFRHHTFTGATKEALEGELRDLIHAHGPVIVRIPTGGGNHAVVAYRVERNGDILVRNPGSYESGLPVGDADRLTLDQYVSFESGNLAAGTGLSSDLSWMTGMSSTYAVVPDADEMRGAMHSPVEFVITDPAGRRLGFDPTANGGEGAFYNEIPGSNYLRLGAVAASDDPDAPAFGEGEFAPIDWHLGDMIEGEYSFRLFAIGEGAWTMNFGISDLGGFDPREFVFGGLTSDIPASGNTFTVGYIPIPAPGAGPLFAIGLIAARRRRRD